MSGGERPLCGACVVDASVLSKLFLPEEGAELAAAVVQGDPTGSPQPRAVPDLAYLECANTFWKWVGRGVISSDVAHDCLAELLSLPLEVWPSASLVGRALAIAVERGVTVYDAAYLALAELLNLPLVTADERLVRKAGGPNDRLHLLGALSPRQDC